MLPINSALILVDIQNDYFPGGKMELEGSIEAGVQAARLLAAFRSQNLSLVHIQHISTRPGATFFLPDTQGVNIHPCVEPQPAETIIQKHFPNSFRQTALLETLKQKDIKTLVLAGMMTHMCIDATTRAAFDLGFECILAHDACATRALKFQGDIVPAKQVHYAFLAALQSTYAKVLSVEEILSDAL